MRTTLLGFALLGAAVSASAALAQTTPAAPDSNPSAAAPADRSGTTTIGPQTESGQPAVAINRDAGSAATPQPGANSFTEGQARSRLEAAGFSDIAELQKDDQGIWRGRGSRNGQQVSVALDFQGNVTSR